MAQMTLKGSCNLRIQCVPGGVDESQGTRSLAKYSQLFEMETKPLQFRDPVKANLQGARGCAAAFEVAAEGGRCVFSWMRQDLTQPVSIFT